MHTPLYREVVKEAIHITRQKKYLWLFGLLAAFLGNGGAFELFAKTFSQIINNGVSFGDTVRILATGWRAVPWTSSIISLGVVLVALLIAIAVVLAIAVVVSHGALIVGCARVHKKKESAQEKMWMAAWRVFWPLAATVVFFKLLTIASVGFAAWPLHLILIGAASRFLVVLFPLIFVVVACFILLCSFLSFYTASFILLEKKEFFDALARAWQLFMEHWLVSFEMAGVTFAASLCAGLAALIGVVLITLPFSLVSIFSFVFAVPIIGFAGVFVSSVLALMYIFFIGSVFATFQTAAWVVLFLRMREGRAGSKLLRLLKVIKPPRAA